MSKVKIIRSEFINLANSSTKKEVAEHYGLDEKEVTKIAKVIGITFKKRKEDTFVIVDDSVDTSVVEVEPTIETVEPTNITNTEIPVEIQ